MNIEFLNSLPTVTNKFDIELQYNEKCVFTAKLSTFGTEKDQMIGMESDFTMTNKRIIIDNHAGIWTIDIMEDIADCTKVKSGFLFFKCVYFNVILNSEMIFDDGKQKLSGFHFYFNEEDTNKFEEIINNVFNR